MDFIDWCGHVLKTLIGVRASSEALAQGGVYDTLLAKALFPDEETDGAEHRESSRRRAIMAALEVLRRFGLIAMKRTGQLFKIEVTTLGRQKIEDMPSLWSGIIAATPKAESVKLLKTVNQRSQRIEPDHVWLADVSREEIPRLGWNDKSRRLEAIRDLEQFNLVQSHPPQGSDLDLRATYEGIVWETRRLPDVGSEPQIVHVLFLDIVGYSKLPMELKTSVLAQLKESVQSSETFQRAKGGGHLISLPTGDGMALVFFRGIASHCECARELSRSLANHPQVELRMGAHTGPVRRIKDINGKENVSGSGIDLAQRVMDCGDAGHILISKTVAEHLKELGSWGEYMHDLGETEVKHGVRVHVFNLYGADFGNSAAPSRFHAKQNPQLL
jgi:class 3 adenylate cyclase